MLTMAEEWIPAGGGGGSSSQPSFIPNNTAAAESQGFMLGLLSRRRTMRQRTIVLLLSSASPFVVVLGFSPISSLRSSSIFPVSSSSSSSSSSSFETDSSSPVPAGRYHSSSSRRFMFSGNPLDMVSSIFSPSAVTADAAQPVQEVLQTMELPDWTAIRSTLESQITSDEERQFRANLEKGYGVGSPLHKIRLFEESNDEQDIRVTFYRDSASKYKTYIAMRCNGMKRV
jgi:hypothetical protein